IKKFIFFLHFKNLRKMLDDIRIFVKTSNKSTKKLFNDYINRYVIVVILINVFSVPSIFSMLFGPIFLPQLFPLVDIYPFEFQKFTILYYFLFFTQVVAVYQLIINTMVIFNSVVLFTYIITEFKVLLNEIERVIKKYEDKQFNALIKKHIQCIEYAENLNYMLRFMILRCFVTVIVTVIFAAIPILFYTKIFEMIRGIAIVITSLMCVLAFTFPADDLYKMGEEIAHAVYDSNWIGTSLSLQKSVIIIMCRSQKPLVIKVDGILPALTCKFYASFLSMTMSYFTTLRAFVESQ
ncbi:GSCOCT00013878001.3-RA-CDS, partial [Cotesia congregata]